MRVFGFVMIVSLCFFPPFLDCVSFKKADNAQGGQSRLTGSRENLASNYASAAQTLQNGSHLQPPVHGMHSKLTFILQAFKKKKYFVTLSIFLFLYRL